VVWAWYFLEGGNSAFVDGCNKIKSKVENNLDTRMQLKQENKQDTFVLAILENNNAICCLFLNIHEN